MGSQVPDLSMESIKSLCSSILSLVKSHSWIIPIIGTGIIVNCIQTAKEELQEKIEKAKTSEAELRTQIAEAADPDKGDLQETLKKLEKENEKLQDENGQLKSEKKKLEKENEKLQDENGQLKSEKKKLQDENGQLKSEKKKLEKENGELQEKNKALEMQNEALEMQNGELCRLNGELQEKNNQLQNEYEWRKARNKPDNITLDAGTAHPNLSIFGNQKSFKHEVQPQNVPPNPERFDSTVCVLGSEGFSSDKHYWEVDVTSSTDWDLGVARKSIQRKGKISLSPKEGFWALGLSGRDYWAKTDPWTRVMVQKKPKKIGVYVSYPEGRVTFFNVTDMSVLFTFNDCSFLEDVYPFFKNSHKETTMRVCSIKEED